MLVLGASVRAAAWSAARAGLSPSGVDLFNDRDLLAVARRCARVLPEEYPRGLMAAAESFPPGPWFYTGGLENYPDLIDQVSRSRPLWGNDSATVRAARDPLVLAGSLLAAGFPAPPIRLDPSGVPRDGSWLRKPIASSGGMAVERFEADGPSDSDLDYYYQQRVAGPSLSAVFIGSRAGAVLAGITQQLIGCPGAPFAYRGNVVPSPLPPPSVRRVEMLGDVLASRFRLVGLFGVDFILGNDGQPWVVELNPRYTASVEVLELATGQSLLHAHRLACGGHALDGAWPPALRRSVAKEILFADAPLSFIAEDEIDWGLDDFYRLQRVTDLPSPGTGFVAGDPVVTIFGQGMTAGGALSDLARVRDAWKVYLRGHAARKSPPF